MGSAIRHLAYQAGKYSKFVDVFGGSGAASAAIPKKDKVTYYYNEKHRTVENLFSVLADEQLHQELIVKLENIVKHIKREAFFYEDVDFEEEIRRYESRRKRGQSDKARKIKEENTLELAIEPDSILQFFKRFKENVIEKDEDFIFIHDDREYTKDELLDISGNPSHFFISYQMLVAYDKVYMPKDGFCLIKGEADGKQMDLYTKNKEYEQFWSYCFYAYFANIRDKKEKITKNKQLEYAVAEFCYLYMVTHGSTGVSSILQMRKDEEGKNYNSVLKFLKMDFRTEIESFHQEIRRFQCSQKDFHGIFLEHDSKNTLFYVDAPYIATQDYEDKKNGVEKFDEKARVKLMDDVLHAEGKVIFSFRAVKNTINNARTNEELRPANREIINQVVFPFVNNMLKEKKKWYVLAVEKGGSLETLVEENKIAEIMITNFELWSFQDESYENVCYKVYSMEEFFLILGNHVESDFYERWRG